MFNNMSLRRGDTCTWGDLHGASGIKCRCIYCRSWFRKDQALVKRFKKDQPFKCPICMRVGGVLEYE